MISSIDAELDNVCFFAGLMRCRFTMLSAIKKLAGTMVNLLLGGNLTLDVRATMVRTYVGIDPW